jgi:archaellum biogenesis protein FlaJ (TadC family)
MDANLKHHAHFPGLMYLICKSSFLLLIEMTKLVSHINQLKNNMNVPKKNKITSVGA